jgi:hypothetical protein
VSSLYDPSAHQTAATHSSTIILIYRTTLSAFSLHTTITSRLLRSVCVPHTKSSAPPRQIPSASYISDSPPRLPSHITQDGVVQWLVRRFPLHWARRPSPPLPHCPPLSDTGRHQRFSGIGSALEQRETRNAWCGSSEFDSQHHHPTNFFRVFPCHTGQVQEDVVS